MAISFEQVLVFHTIVQAGSFKAAAEVLHKTQPAISLAIKKLEEGMEVELFDRSGYRPELSVHGRAFHEKSLKALEGMRVIDDLSRSFRQKEEPELTIAIDGISPLPKILHIFKNFGDQYHNTKLNLTYENLSEPEDRVLKGGAQIGITNFISSPQSLEVVPFSTVKMVPVMSAELFKGKKVRSEEDLKDLHQIVLGDQNGPQGVSFGLLDSGLKWRIRDNNFKHEIILAGLGWGHLPLHSIENEVTQKKLVVLEFETIHPRELIINLIRHKRFTLGPVAKALWNKLAESKKS